jgi:hypothetical protein
MDRPRPALPGNPESRFRKLLDPVRKAILQSDALDDIHDALAELRRVESVAEEQRLRLTLNGLHTETPTLEHDQTLDSVQTAARLGRSRDWVYHHRGLLRPALVSPGDSRPRYSTRELDRLCRGWKAKQEVTE